MSIGATTLDDDPLSDFIFRLSDPQSVIWDDHTWNSFSEFQISTQNHIMDLLARGNRLSEFLAFKLAWLGSSPEKRPLIEKEIVHLIRMPDGVIRQVGWKKFKNGCVSAWDATCEFTSKTVATVQDFWEEYKTEILIGVGIAATAVAVTAVIIYSGGTAAQPAIALGAATVNNLLQDSPEEPSLPIEQTLVNAPSPLPEISIPAIESLIDQTAPSFTPNLNVDTLIPIQPLELPFLNELSETDRPPDFSLFEPLEVAPNPLFFPQSTFLNFPEYRPPSSTPPPYPFPPSPTPLDTLESCIPSPFKGTLYTIDPEWGPQLYTQWEATLTSENFEVSGAQLPNGRFGGIAGINTSQLHNEIYANSISYLAKKHHVDWTYNATHSFPVDLAESVFLNYAGHSAPAKLLIKNWTQFAKDYENNPHAKYFQICHSQGAIHVKNALEQCPEALRKKIIVLAIAPGEVVPKSLCYDSYNYASSRDLVAYGKLVSQAFAGPDNDERNQKNFMDLKELIILDPHPDAPIFDHGFDSPTFKKEIKRHVDEFMEKHGK